LKGAVAIAQRDGNGAGAQQGEVLLSIAVEVCHGDRDGGLRAIRDGRTERAVAVSQQDRVASADGRPDVHYQIELSVAIEVTHSDCAGATAELISFLPAEGTAACVQEDGNGTVAAVDRHQVGLAIAIEIAHSERLRCGAEKAGSHWVIALGLEAAMTVVEQDGHGALTVFAGFRKGSDIRRAIAIEIRRDDR
jgi:hypothetical protein